MDVISLSVFESDRIFFKTLKYYYLNSNCKLMQESPWCSNQCPLLTLTPKLCHFGNHHYKLVEKFSVFYKASRVESLLELLYKFRDIKNLPPWFDCSVFSYSNQLIDQNNIQLIYKVDKPQHAMY